MSGSFGAETLDLLGRSPEVYIATSSDANSPERRTIIWVVTLGGEVFVRSVRGQKGRWYQRISAYPEGALHVRDNRIPVRAVPVPDEETVDAVSAAIKSKYEEEWPGPTASMLRPEVLSTALKLTPA